MGMAIRRARTRPATVPLGQRGGPRRRAAARQEPQPASAHGCGCVPGRREPVWRDGHGRQRMAMDGRIHGRAYPRGGGSRRQLLLSPGLRVVFPELASADRARQAAVDGPQQRPRRHARLPLRDGRRVIHPGAPPRTLILAIGRPAFPPISTPLPPNHLPSRCFTPCIAQARTWFGCGLALPKWLFVVFGGMALLAPAACRSSRSPTAAPPHPPPP